MCVCLTNTLITSMHTLSSWVIISPLLCPSLLLPPTSFFHYWTSICLHTNGHRRHAFTKTVSFSSPPFRKKMRSIFLSPASRRTASWIRPWTSAQRHVRWCTGSPSWTRSHQGRWSGPGTGKAQQKTFRRERERGENTEVALPKQIIINQLPKGKTKAATSLQLWKKDTVTLLALWRAS